MRPFVVLKHGSGRRLKGSLVINRVNYFSGLLFLSVMRVWMKPAKLNQFLMNEMFLILALNQCFMLL